MDDFAQCFRSIRTRSRKYSRNSCPERKFWAGRPSARIIFHRRDAQLVPFSLLWGGFAIFCESLSVLGITGRLDSHIVLKMPPVVMALFCFPFVLIGQYFIWGRFVYAARKKKQTYYAVTNQRVIAVQTCSKRQVATTPIGAVAALIKERRPDGFGTLRFTPAPGLFEANCRGNWLDVFRDPDHEARRRWVVWDPLWIGEGPALVDIENVDSVCQLISALQAREVEARVSALLSERTRRG